MRTYRQFCPAARALDVIGDRWTLLVIRELLFGVKRYTDLQDGLPGIGPNVLTDRLRALENAGLIRRRRLPRPAASTVYELTELGSGLRPVLAALFDWGLNLLDSPAPGDTIKANYWLPAIQAAANPEVITADIDDIYEFRVGAECITIEVAHHRISVREGPAESPDVVIDTDHETFAKLGMRRISAVDAIQAGKLSVQGDPAASERCAAIFTAPTADHSGLTA